MKFRKRFVLSILLMLFFSSTAIMCKDDKGSNGSKASLNNVWEVKSIYDAEEGVTTTFPDFEGSAKARIFIKINDNSVFQTYYLNNGFDGFSAYLNGLWTCSDNIINFTLSGTSMEIGTDENIKYDISGDSLTLTDTGGSITKLVKSNSSLIKDAADDCTIFDFEENSDTPDAALNNVWEVRSLYVEGDDDEEAETITYPMTDGEYILRWYYEISDNSTIQPYYFADGFYDPEENGLWTCTDYNMSFTLDGDSMIDVDMDIAIYRYKISGNTLILNMFDMAIYRLTLADPSSIVGAVEDCSIFEDEEVKNFVPKILLYQTRKNKQ